MSYVLFTLFVTETQYTENIKTLCQQIQDYDVWRTLRNRRTLKAMYIYDLAETTGIDDNFYMHVAVIPKEYQINWPDRNENWKEKNKNER